MTYKNLMGIFPYKTASHISLLKYTKSACGVDFMLNTADSNERQGWFNLHERYKTDFFEFFFSARHQDLCSLTETKSYCTTTAF